MKKFLCLLLTIIFSMSIGSINAQEAFVETIGSVEPNDSDAVVEISNEIICAATGITYSSEDEFYNNVAKDALEVDESLIYYTYVNCSTGKRYIYSNKDSEDIIQSICAPREHVEEQDIDSKAITDTAGVMSYNTIPPYLQGQTPYSNVCQLFLYVSGVGMALGTGFFVGPHTIATVAHNLRPIVNGQMLTVDSATIYYSYMDSSNVSRWGQINMSGYSLPENFSVAETEAGAGMDYALINISSDIGNLCGYMKLFPEEIDTIPSVSLLGFPAEGSSNPTTSGTVNNMRYSSSGSTSNVTINTFRFTNDFFPGQSGAPLFNGLIGYAYGIAKLGDANGVHTAHKINWDSYTFFNKNVGFKNLSIYQIDSTTKSNGVKSFQQYINNNLPMQYLGTKLTVDGGFGPATKTAAIKMLQYWLNTTYGAGLAIDGSFGPATTNAIQSVVYGQTGMGVYILQGLLYGNGYDPKGFDGSFGANGGQGCLNAVKYFQSDNNLQVDGRAGPATLYALCS